MLRMIYKITLNVPTTPAACGGTGSSVKRSENWSHPIPSIGLGRHTTTTGQVTKGIRNCSNTRAFVPDKLSIFHLKNL